MADYQDGKIETKWPNQPHIISHYYLSQPDYLLALKSILAFFFNLNILQESTEFSAERNTAGVQDSFRECHHVADTADMEPTYAIFWYKYV